MHIFEVGPFACAHDDAVLTISTFLRPFVLASIDISNWIFFPAHGADEVFLFLLVLAVVIGLAF